jgi:hypothetical protein
VAALRVNVELAGGGRKGERAALAFKSSLGARSTAGAAPLARSPPDFSCVLAREGPGERLRTTAAPLSPSRKGLAGSVSRLASKSKPRVAHFAIRFGNDDSL